jgi:cysteine desulfurase / selenocysteine lyase
MRNYKEDFASFEGKIWLNAASEGPLPLAAAESLQQCVEWKSKPYRLDIPKFNSVPKELKKSIGRLIGVKDKDVILSNSASYGLHILSNGISWREGDEILLMQNDFPSDILPWLALERKGVKVIQIPPEEKILYPNELLENITVNTRLFCISHVHTFTGFTLEIEKFAEICKDRGIIFVLNLSQSVGTRPVDISSFPVDAVVCAGYKWLCGPYATGFCWIKPELRNELHLNQAYWGSLLSAEELTREGPLTLKDLKTARKYDVFCPANFFNFVPFKTAIDYWLEVGVDNVHAYHNELIDKLVNWLNGRHYDLISPKEGRLRSSLVVLSHKNKDRNKKIFKDLTGQGIYAALWKGNLRIAPHIYNTEEEIEQLVQALDRM